jgi:hypothetical protein
MRAYWMCERAAVIVAHLVESALRPLPSPLRVPQVLLVRCQLAPQVRQLRVELVSSCVLLPGQPGRHWGFWRGLLAPVLPQ